jgi:hypothetical protein
MDTTDHLPISPAGRALVQAMARRGTADLVAARGEAGGAAEVPAA